jgi:hypothetical protein
LETIGCPKKALYVVSKSVTSNYIVTVRKFSRVPKVTGRAIWPTGVAATPETVPWKGARLGHNKDLDNPIWSKIFWNKMWWGATSIDKDSVELDILDDGANYERILPWLWHKVWVALKVLEGGGWDRLDLLGCEFLLPPWLIRIRATIDIVDLLVSFGEVALGFFGHFL